MTKEEYYREYPWSVIQDFLHEKYGDCMECRTMDELVERLAKYGHTIIFSSRTQPETKP